MYSYLKANSINGMIAVILLSMISFSNEAYSWGGTGHRIINQKAPMHLPASMSSLKADSLFYASHASDADYRKSSSDTSFFAETYRHYIDIDNYPDFYNLPHSLDSLIMIYGRSNVRSQGTLPWAIKFEVDSLTAQLKRGNTAKAESTMSDLGHYVADAHMPLHCTANYWVGGLHSRYETDMINTYQSFLIIQQDSVHYINSPLDFAFEIIYHSNFLVNSVIQADTYAKTASGWSGSGNAPAAYYTYLWDSTKNFTIAQFQHATVALANLWYTAWVNSNGPSFALNKQNINFNDLMVLGTKMDSLTVTNSGSATLNILSVTSSSYDFIVTPNADSVLAGASKKFYITFSPSTPGSKLAKLIFTTNTYPQQDTVSVSGNGVLPALFAITTHDVDFGEIISGNTKRDSVTVTNSGGMSLNISSVTSTNSEFNVSPTTAVIAPSSTQKFFITFSPITGGSKSADIIFDHNAAETKDTVHVIGSATQLAVFSINRSHIDFGELASVNTKLDSIVVFNPGTVTLNITSIASTNAEFSISPLTANVFPSNSQKFYVSFNPSSYGIKNGEILFVSNASELFDTLHLTGSYATVFTMDVTDKWNLISIPFRVLDFKKSVLFPSAISEAYMFNNGYTIRTTLSNGVGYWLKFEQADTVSYSGFPLEADTIDVAAGWNLIGSISTSVPVGSIVQQPSGIIISNYFGYDNGYTAADVISPAHAYWVKSREPGKLILRTTLTKK
jgi:hypothetical protein